MDLKPNIFNYFIEYLGFDESGREVLFTAAAASNDADEKITPVAGKPKITPVAGEPRTPLLSKPISNQNSIIPNKNKAVINSASSDGEHRLVGLDVDQIYNAGEVLVLNS